MYLFGVVIKLINCHVILLFLFVFIINMLLKLFWARILTASSILHDHIFHCDSVENRTGTIVDYIYRFL